MIVRRTVLAAALIAGILTGSPASAAPPPCTPPAPSDTKPGYLVADPDCDLDGTAFTALPGARVHTGVRAGAAYRIEVPQRWNGRLVVYAHGYRGTGATVYVSNPELRQHYISRGYAWAASSYATNGYDVGQGVRDTHALIDVFRQVTGRTARKVYVSGASMGGHITAVAIEEHPRSFTGAMPYCGVLGDTELFDYFLDANVTAAALADVELEFPLRPDAAYPARFAAQVGQIRAALTGTALATWSDVVERRSGGERPGFDAAFTYWNAASQGGLPFLFSLYPGLSGGTAGIAPGNLTDNRRTYYRSTDRLWPTAAERALNKDVLRVARTAVADPGLAGVPRVDGRPSVPVLSLHGIGDLFVPFSMEQEYARRAFTNGRSHLFVSRAVRDVSHCGFTQPELRRAFDDLTTWTDRGRRPGGDAILSRHTVADPNFGCRFTVGVRPAYAPCPAG
ncbi:prolyl oligopeptidase family serine peptidase [Actinoplanes sp. NEAU-A12]|uniref:Prolyl oligopeptidase family serine peptidase n=1 Tax=Actinoplanes sandaracinus TaxID=3045177 RepID=A0ABT6WMQ5_9ACTN|nr:prolyl oligopeptidase family serine peptidase [Actinoplanes sandaracinus]MDI6100998.1 prolyl oligopeptidase family serine peptidase [Actinoplanes sandaracinus]